MIARPGLLTTVMGTALLLAAVILLLMWPYPERWTNNWFYKVLDLGHLPLFGLLTFGLWRFFRSSVPLAAGPAVGLAAGLAAVLAVLAEFGQAYVGRYANYPDLLRSILGILLAVVWILGYQQPHTTRKLAGSLLATTLLLTWPLVDAVPFLIGVHYSYQAFPVLCDFQIRSQIRYWRLHQSVLDRVPDPYEEDEWAGRLVFLQNEDPYIISFSSAELRPVVMDWSEYQELCWDFTVTDGPLDLTFYVTDNRPTWDASQIFSRKRRCEEGRHEISFSLAEIEQSPRTLPLLDLTQVECTTIYISSSKTPETLLIHKVYLR